MRGPFLRRGAAATPPPAPPPTGLDRWRRRSARVQVLRRLTPWVMALIVVGVGGWLAARAIIQMLRPTTAGQEIRMSRPRFIGRDDHGKPYVLRADGAVRDARDSDLIHLTRPDMLLQVGKPAPATLRGDTGTFNEATRLLSVFGHTVFTDGSGYTFSSERAFIDTYTLDVHGDAAVSGEGPLGRTRAMAYAIHDRGLHVVFTGDVHTHLNNGSPPP